jgi:DNA polymerase-3 subunit alpha
MDRVAESVGFVHLRVHSAFSLLEGALPLKRLVDLAKADAMPALAITDTGNLFGALEFSVKMSEAGVQPIIGCQLAVDFDHDPDQESGVPEGAANLESIVLLAASEAGYWNLVKLVSDSFLKSDGVVDAHVTPDQLAGHAEGLIALTGGPGGPVNRRIVASDLKGAREKLEWLAATYGDRLYVELQRHNLDPEAVAEPHLVAWAYGLGLPLVAVNEPFFAERDDHGAHDALICIAQGTLVSVEDRRRVSEEHYFKTRAQMVELFADIPEASANTVEIAMRCGWWPATRAPILPRFANNTEDAAAIDAREGQMLREAASKGLAKRLTDHGLAEGVSREDYTKRLDYELSIIERMKYPGYFLIVAEFVQWAKLEGIPVGPGRGSGAGSVVAWSLTITEMDPLRFSLLFERFLNPDRVSMPDFDVDFCQNRRDRVIEHVQEKYGDDQVAQIITFGTLQARAVLRDVGRVLEVPYGQVDRLAKMVPQNPAAPVTLSRAIADEPRLQAARDEEPVVARLLTIAQKLEGLYRHASTHAAGVVIGDRPLNQLVPLYRDPRSGMKVSQFNMKWVEQAGLVKFDFLGLKTLTVLDLAIRNIQAGGVDLTLAKIPLDDARTFEMLTRGESIGVFQVESGGMRRALVDMKPDRFEDLIALVALFRPGPMANIPTYCLRKHGLEEPEYLHPRLEPILRETYGVITYQEQVMQIARDLGGFSLGEADLLRRAMGKKIRAEMEAQRARFVSGATEQGITRPIAVSIFDACSKFADYGFNKSHSAPYALITYQTAYLKANYPAEYFAASLTLEIGNTDKIADYRREAQRLEIVVEAPSVNRSGVDFDVVEGRIAYSLAAVRGVGVSAVEHLVEVRQNGRFTDLADFARRISPKFINRRALESLIAAGALDELEPDRARLVAGIDRILGLAARVQESAEIGQDDLFGRSGEREPLLLPVVDPWLGAEKLKREFDAVGFYLSAHPLDEYAPVLKKMRAQNWAEFSEAVRNGASAGRLAGTVTAKQERRTRNGNRMAVLQLSDPTGAYEAVLFADALVEYRDMVEPGSSVVALVGAEDRPEGISLRIQSVESIEDLAAHLSQIRIFVRDAKPLQHVKTSLPGGGGGEVSVIMLNDDGRQEVEIRLKDRYVVSPQVASAIRAVPGVVQVELV